jgi:hypothetical protein
VPPDLTVRGHTRTRMDWHDFITMRGAEAIAVTAIAVFLAGAWRVGRRVRAKTREAFARSIGAQVAEAMKPIVERMDTKVDTLTARVDEMRRDFDIRRAVDDERWGHTRSLYERLTKHMDTEDNKDGNDG